MPKKQEIIHTTKGIWVIGTLYLIAYFLGHWATGGSMSEQLDETPRFQQYVMIPILGFALELLTFGILCFANYIGKEISKKNKTTEE